MVNELYLLKDYLILFGIIILGVAIGGLIIVWIARKLRLI